MNNTQVYKFGGASVKDADGVKNLADIISHHKPEKLVIVVSAMGKTTNALELLTHSLFEQNNQAETILNDVKDFHLSIVNQLFDSSHPIYSELEDNFAELYWAIEETQLKSFDYEYDQIVSQGELISTKIVAAYLNQKGISTTWADARDFIKTDNNYRDAGVDWIETEMLVNETIQPEFEKGKIVLTQGFIGSTSENFNTTLGREGSDYSAAILAYCLNADKVTIWKDVAGVLNADPKKYSEAELLSQLSFQDAVEMAFFGASVIHPKTIKPLQNKDIPLFVRSFIDSSAAGTSIGETTTGTHLPCYIIKENQYLLSITPKDFSFVVDEHLSRIFAILSEHKAKTNQMINSALSFSICININQNHWEGLLNELKQHFKVKFNTNCTLLTIRNYAQAKLDFWLNGKEILLEQRTRTVAQYVVK